MSLFDQNNDNNDIDQNKDYLEELIGPGGKFDVSKHNNDRDAAIKAMAKGKALADKTLEQRNKEFDELREAFLAKSDEADKKSAEADAKAKFEELLTRMETAKNQNNQDDTNKSGIVNQPSLDPSKIEEIVANKLQEIEVRKRENDNLSAVDSRLRERFGDNAAAILKEKMNTLGISNDDLKFLAKRSPEAVFNTLGLNQQQENYQAPVRNSSRNDSFSPKTTTRDAVYWEKMRKEEPKKYFSPDNSVQRLKDMDSPDFLKRYQELSKN